MLRLGVIVFVSISTCQYNEQDSEENKHEVGLFDK